MKAPGIESKLKDVVFSEADRGNKVKISIFPIRWYPPSNGQWYSAKGSIHFQVQSILETEQNLVIDTAANSWAFLAQQDSSRTK